MRYSELLLPTRVSARSDFLPQSELRILQEPPLAFFDELVLLSQLGLRKGGRVISRRAHPVADVIRLLFPVGEPIVELFVVIVESMGGLQELLEAHGRDLLADL